MASADSALIVFTLSPEAEGKRKSLGLGRPDRAAAVFATILEHLERVCNGLPGVDVLLATPRDSSHRRQDFGPSPVAKHLPQRGRSFGESLRLAVEDAFSLGYHRVVVIGNDSPEISGNYLEQAFDALADAPRAAVLGPARDGGYALLGLSAPCPQAFESIPWGSSRVARTTLARLAASGFAVARLATLEDIDDPRSLARFLARAREGILAELANLARKIATLLSPASLTRRPSQRYTQQILFAGWLPLRAPPCRAGALA